MNVVTTDRTDDNIEFGIHNSKLGSEISFNVSERTVHVIVSKDLGMIEITTEYSESYYDNQAAKKEDKQEVDD